MVQTARRADADVVMSEGVSAPRHVRWWMPERAHGTQPFRMPESADALAVRSVAVVRVGIAVTVAATGSFLPEMAGKRATLLLLLGLAWVPWATVVLFASDRAGHPVAVFGGPAGDLLAMFAVQSLAPSANEAALLGYLVVIAFAVYTAGRSYAALLGAGAIALSLVAQSAVPASERLDNTMLVPFSAAIVALVFLLDRTATLQARATIRYQHLQSKSDTILAHVADGVMVTDALGTVLQCNPAALRILGAGSSESPVGLACHEVLGLHDGARAFDCSSGCPLLSMGSGADAVLGHEVWRTEAGGRRQPLLANAALVPGDERGHFEVVHSLRDITRLKQAEEAKTMFLATASHELKTPLTVINGFAETLARYDDIDPVTKSAALDAIRTRARELTRIVDRLLLSSRIEAGRVRLTLQEFAIGPVVEERVAAFGSATTRSVDIEIPPGLPMAFGNQDALITVVEHLLDNAIKYSPDGQAVLVRASSDGETVCIEVTDQGIGMDAEEVAHCFDKFWQAESTDVRRFGGTGIGLYIVQSLVETMGGHVTVRSTLGQGTTFSVRLPQTERHNAADRFERRRPEGDPGVGEASSIREFMRQIGVPERRGQ
jgi:signal transduction histidine kinase